MTNKYIYFIANWKMFGDKKSLKTLNKVIKFSKINKNYKFKLIYCPPYTLLNLFSKKLRNTNISIGAQNCHQKEISGAYSGSISPAMLKKIGAQYVIIGHSENRAMGETDLLVNEKIKSSIKSGLKIIFCIGESLSQRKKKQTHKILKNQITKGLKGIKKLNNIFFAYEPLWSIGTGIIPKINDLEKNIHYLKNNLRKKFKLRNPKILYGGSVNPINIKNLREINVIDGFLVGGASLDPKKFIDIVKKTFN
jgi:triosephosphate isomerase (TIM)